MERSLPIRTFLFSLEIFICFIIQGTPSLFIELLGETPVLVLSAAFSLAVFETPTRAVIFGAVCGVLVDIGAGSLVGPVGLVTALVCCGISYVFAEFLKPNFIFSALFCAVGIFLSVSAIFLFNFAIYDYGENADFYIQHSLPTMLYTWIFAILFYVINKSISGNMKIKLP